MKPPISLNLLILLYFGLLASSSEPIPKPTDNGKEKDLVQARCKAAQEAYRELFEEKKQGRFDPESLYVGSKRLLEAQREAASNKDEELAAFQKHFDRMRDLQKRFQEHFVPYDGIKSQGYSAQGYSHLNQALVELFRAESELWLHRAKQKK